MTMAEKILSAKSGIKSVSPGDVVEAAVDAVMLHDIGVPGVRKPLEELSGGKIHPGVTCVVIPDHFVPAPTVQAAENLRITEEFAKKNGLAYYGQGRGGICHQVMIEKGYILPGQIVAAPDAHATSYGALGAFGAGFGVTDVAIAMACGHLWFEIPKTIQFVLGGHFNKGVYAKDLILHILHEFEDNSIIYYAAEFCGPGTAELSMDDRICICNLAYEMGVKACFVVPDEITAAYLQKVTGKRHDFVLPDRDAVYEKTVSVDLGNIPPMLSLPHNPQNGAPVANYTGTKIDQAFLGSCTNGRIEDLRIAASAMKGRKVADGVRMIITPASVEVMEQAIKEGLWETFIEAGALLTNPGCGICLGGHLGLLASGENCISSSNRNFLGRMGSVEANIYLASPMTVALAAIHGEIVDPRRYSPKEAS
ncbi:3-isopropylmalate dehydratase large subunit [Treponema primitia]|uniref:3-isopropylmalate dehydratase large subunit n=1 Tax=Treponema primitia TaxID=88058 RepID=UPI00397F10CB